MPRRKRSRPARQEQEEAQEVEEGVAEGIPERRGRRGKNAPPSKEAPELDVIYEDTPFSNLPWKSERVDLSNVNLEDDLFHSLEVLPGDAFDVVTMGEGMGSMLRPKSASASPGARKTAKAGKPPSDVPEESPSKKVDREEEPPGKKKRKRKRKRAEKASAGADKGPNGAALDAQAVPQDDSDDDAAEENTEDEIVVPEEVMGEVLENWGHHGLHPLLLEGLARLGFTRPTPIQEASLTPAVKHHKDIVGAAETGSGKTLAFGLPILHRLLERRERLGMPVTKRDTRFQAAAGSAGGERPAKRPRVAPSPQWDHLPALILSPTRELAVQIASHLRRLAETTAIRVGVVVGGLSEVKQERVLNQRPDIIVATPGRLWDRIQGGHAFLADLSALQFLVLDEADRMVEKGHYKELAEILASLQSTSKPHVTTDPVVLERIQQKAIAQGRDPNDALKEMGFAAEVEPKKEEAGGGEEERKETRFARQNFLFSATLGFASQPAAKGAAHALVRLAEIQVEGREKGEVALSRMGKKQRRRLAAQAATLSAVEALMLQVNMQPKPEILRVARADDPSIARWLPEEQAAMGKKGKKVTKGALVALRMGEVIVLRGQAAVETDKTDGKDDPKKSKKDGGKKTMEESEGEEEAEEGDGAEDVAGGVALPMGLRLARISCPAEEKDQWLYYFLLHYPGRTLVFVNTIAALKRLVALFQELRLPVRGLHANMPQRQRLKNLDRFKDEASSVLVATDVAARGLDIPSVEHVIHYNLPSHAETFVHRSGRTARAHQEGLALAIIGPKDHRSYVRIMAKLNMPAGLPEFPVDHRYLRPIVARMSIARKLEDLHTSQQKRSKQHSWMLRTMDDADLPMDELLRAESGLAELEDDEEEEEEEDVEEVEDGVVTGRGGKRKRLEAAGPGRALTRREQKAAAEAASLRRELDALLEQRVLPRGTSTKYLTTFNATRLDQAAGDEALGEGEVDTGALHPLAPLMNQRPTGASNEAGEDEYFSAGSSPELEWSDDDEKDGGGQDKRKPPAMVRRWRPGPRSGIVAPPVAAPVSRPVGVAEARQPGAMMAGRSGVLVGGNALVTAKQGIARAKQKRGKRRG